jgi:hypothetical protein
MTIAAIHGPLMSALKDLPHEGHSNELLTLKADNF